MNKFLLSLFFLFSTLFGAELDWSHNYDEALKQAQKEQKGVYLFIGADVCRWCDKFKDMTLSKEHVIKRLREEYVLLYLSRDRHKIPKHFEVKGVPRHYFLTNEGKVIHADRGSREVEGFFTLLDEVSLKKEN
ncbi:MAG: thioredoxin [Sulfurimonas sp. RIFOXYD12_FULL_33_39]|uniref:thioredoxin family protein n=1 Tax=unclassified Sulfurimonas TaxID=2623549 RepID=UPI0008D2B28E|nr:MULTISPECIES: thioredoxin family protein [unclassified Sulfurimonas]OHE07130.1 MAG: thioredoxin [Sulfurimonas sp. RIFCSPLOWO2_12_FULL_34_6]OHE09779.1 MAG: thioredoxin [Sulfurimonas sp. RIFOXYD12_FULL_33_39]OHE13713.1 MAG: thioredoxin [Sulfurimonas sp. RIFOXYD2_FULL_34_21]DAB28072.1 MAG TPA: thioredoxin [Sulfurimonas sp. UBA10385]